MKKRGNFKVVLAFLLFSLLLLFSGGCDGGGSNGGAEPTAPDLPPAPAPVAPTLTSLELSAGTLVPAFSPDVTQYAVSVDNTITSVTVTTTTDYSNASLTVNSVNVASGVASAPVNLNVGANTITVTAANTASSTSYIIAVTRAAEEGAESEPTTPNPGGGGGGGAEPETENLAKPVGFELANGEHITAENVVLYDNVYKIKNAIEYDEATDAILLSPINIVYLGDTQNTISLSELKAGDVVIVDPSDTFPGGFQRVIKGIMYQNGKYIITSEMASMSDIFENIDFSMNVVFDGRFIDPEPQTRMSNNGTRRADPSFSLDAYLTEDAGGAKGGFTVHADGDMAASIGTELMLNVAGNPTDGFSGTVDMTLNWSVGPGHIEADFLQSLQGHFKPIPFTIMGVPAGVKLKPSLLVKAELQRELKGVVRSSYQIGAKGSQPTKEEMKPSGNNGDSSFTLEDLTSVTVSIEPSLEVYIYGGHEGGGQLPDPSVSGGIVITPGAIITLEKGDSAGPDQNSNSYSIYDQLSIYLGVRLHAKVPKAFFDLGLDFKADFAIIDNKKTGKFFLYNIFTKADTIKPTIDTSSLPGGVKDKPYYATLAASGTAPITWGIIGTLPTGLSLNNYSGVISGTPTTLGTSNFIVRATNSAGNATKDLSITITSTTGDWILAFDRSWYDNNPSATEYTLTTAEQLAGLAWLASYEGINFLGKTISLQNDISLAGKEWMPILGFAGTFDGKGHKISNMTIASQIYIPARGLFSDGMSGTLKNIRLTDVYIDGRDDSAIVGSIACVSSGTISNCTSSGVIIAQTISNTIGGIVGRNDFDATVTDCTSSVELSVHDTPPTNSSNSIGGVVGDNLGVVSACTSTGDILIEAPQGKSAYMGGIVGYNSTGEIVDCQKLYGEISVTGYNAALHRVGGLVGVFADNESGFISGNAYSPTETGQAYGIGEDDREENRGPSNNYVDF